MKSISRNFSAVCLHFFPFFFTGLAGGFWGNHVLHNGVVEFEIATQNIVGIVRHIQVKLPKITKKITIKLLKIFIISGNVSKIQRSFTKRY